MIEKLTDGDRVLSTVHGRWKDKAGTVRVDRTPNGFVLGFSILWDDYPHVTNVISGTSWADTILAGLRMATSDLQTVGGLNR